MMEHDDSDPDAVRAQVQAILSANLLSYKLLGFNRSTIANRLKTDMIAAIELGADVLGSKDDIIDGVKEVRLTLGDVLDAHNGLTVNRTLDFFQSDCFYRIQFQFRRA